MRAARLPTPSTGAVNVELTGTTARQYGHQWRTERRGFVPMTRRWKEGQEEIRRIPKIRSKQDRLFWKSLKERANA